MHTLMIVDDSNIIRNRIARCESEGLFQVVGRAVDGEEAVRLFNETRPQLVTMDLTMPHMDGLECIEKLIAIDPKVKILVVSALADKATAIRAIKNGARGFLNKPFEESDLINALTEVINAEE